MSAPTTVKSDILAGIGAGAEYVITDDAGEGGPRRSVGNNLPLGRVGLIDLFFLEENRPDSRNSCAQKAMRLD